MRFHRGTPPVLYHLAAGDTPVGAIMRGENDRLMLSLHGYLTPADAADAAWAAHRGRAAYEAQSAGATPATRMEVADTLRLLLVSLRRPAEPEPMPRLVVGDEPGVQRLCLGDAEIGVISEMAVESGPALWSLTVPLGEAAPAVFTMAAARRMWSAVVDAGLQRRMAQWGSPANPNQLRLTRTIHDWRMRHGNALDPR